MIRLGRIYHENIRLRRRKHEKFLSFLLCFRHFVLS